MRAIDELNNVSDDYNLIEDPNNILARVMIEDDSDMPVVTENMPVVVENPINKNDYVNMKKDSSGQYAPSDLDYAFIK
jgi:hypothetical protein